MPDDLQASKPRGVTNANQIASSGAVLTLLLVLPLVMVPWLREWKLADGRMVPLGFIVSAVPALTAFWAILANFSANRSRNRARRIGLVAVALGGLAACIWIGVSSLLS